MQATSHCWICEGWSEFEFIYKPPEKIDSDIVPVNLHLSCDDFLGELLEPSEEGEQTFSVKRMLPPGIINYYYTVDNDKVVYDSRDTTDQYVDKVNRMHSTFDGRITVPKTNMIANLVVSRRLIDISYLANMKVFPRPKPYILKGRIKLKTPWDFFKSIFKAYRVDNQALLDTCFDVDWANTKCEKFISARSPDDLPKIKEYIKSIYKHVREAYKYYSGISPLGRVTSIGSGILGELIGKCNNFIDG